MNQQLQDFRWPADPAKPPPTPLRVILTKAYATLLYANEDGDFLLDENLDEVEVPVPVGTIMEVAGVRWIGGAQGWGFELRPIGDQFPDPVPGQFDLADFGPENPDNRYTFAILEG